MSKEMREHMDRFKNLFINSSDGNMYLYSFTCI